MRRLAIGDGVHEAADYAGAVGDVASLPFSLRVLAENAFRTGGAQAARQVAARGGAAVPFRPQRLLLQDMLGLPLLVDLMALRTAAARAGADASAIDMSLPVDLVIDHALTLHHWAAPDALEKNQRREFEVNRERFAFLKACEARFAALRIFPPGGGIMHQINLEHLAQVVVQPQRARPLLVPDTCLGTDSHTPMVNALGVLGWGIGGLEAEAIMLGEAASVNVPRVVGLEITGTLPGGCTATDIALAAAEKLRAHGVVDCFVELFGPGYGALPVPDRATIANMAPEYGATCVFCPVDGNTLRYLRETGRAAGHVARAEAFCRAQRLWAGEGRVPEFDSVVSLDLGRLQRVVSGPARPEQCMPLARAPARIGDFGENAHRRVPVPGERFTIGDGDVLIAAITSCTNTANPRNMVLAGLVAREALARGLRAKPWVKTSLAPGSRVVARYLARAGLQEALDALGFQVAGFACSTCNGMSGPLAPGIEAAVREHGINAVAVLSGNRNFPGRINPLAARNLLASPPLVVAYALAGTVRADLTTQPLGHDRKGRPVLLEDLWPDEAEVRQIMHDSLEAEDFRRIYGGIEAVSPRWNGLEVEEGEYPWPPSSYISFPPYLRDLPAGPAPPRALNGLRPLAILGDSITTDHISPSGAILPDSAAGRYLIGQRVRVEDFNSYGTRRGCSEVVVRSAFANPRLRNEMAPGHEGPWTRLEPEGRIVPMFEAIETYRRRGQPLMVIAGRAYGCGSSRDTAAKAPWLAGVRAVVAESFERIHRSNLVNMGVAPLCFAAGANRHSLGLDGSETFDIAFDRRLTSARMTIHRAGGGRETVPLVLRLDNEAERETFHHGGLLARMFRQIAGAGG